jgi:hypothetical protein
MTVQADYQINPYITNGVGPYLFSWMVGVDTSVMVAIDDVILEENVDFTVAANTPDTGGSITLVEVPTPGLVLLIARKTAQTQTLDLAPYTRFPSEANETALDKLTMIVQEQGVLIDELADEISKSVYLDVVGSVFITT